MRLKFAAVSVALILASAAGATTVLSENFNATGFRGAFLQNDVTDRFGPSPLYYAANFGGWTFADGTSGGFPVPLIATTVTGTDGAAWLQEYGSSMSYTLTGLTAGKLYTVSLLQSGDNIAGGSWTYGVTVDGGTIYSGSGTTGLPGTNPGQTVTSTFTATGNSAVLKFADTTASGGSNVVIDDVKVTAVPEPAAWSLLIAGFGLVGVAARRRRVTVAA